MNEYRFALGLFEAVGVELEYAIVDRETLNVLPIADEVLRAKCGAYEAEIEVGDIAWSNELALHVLELKTNGPVPALRGLAGRFQDHVCQVNGVLDGFNAMLMPSPMHPWMDPREDLRVWPHEYNLVYETFDRIFNCKSHGWANVQSTHINLPFGDDVEFGRLHAAIRLVLPLLPALAAASPLVDGTLTGAMDSRLEWYCRHAARIPEVAGAVIPEAVYTRAEYEGALLGGLYRALTPHDPDGVLHHEWANARGCIARFDRGSIEIRLLDIQECPAADVAICAAVIAVVRALVEETFLSYAAQRAWSVDPLRAILSDTIFAGDMAPISDREFLAAFEYTGPTPCRAGDLWAHILDRTLARQADTDEWDRPLRTIIEHGCLARRLTLALGRDPSPARIRAVYGELCECLASGAMFQAPAAPS